MHKKQPSENHAYDLYQSFHPNFRRPKVDAIRDWPRWCGKFIPPTGFKRPKVDAVRDWPRWHGKFMPPLVSKEIGDNDSTHTGDIAKMSYEGLNEMRNTVGEVGETSAFMGKWDQNDKGLCSLLRQEIQDGVSLKSFLERSGCKETGNKVLNDFRGDVETNGAEVKWVHDAKELCTSLGQETQGGEACNHILGRSTLRKQSIEVHNNSRDGPTSSFMDRWGSDTEGIQIHHQSEGKLPELDPQCQTVGNKSDRGKNVLRNTEEIESCKDQNSKDHQTIVENSRVKETLRLFQKLLEKLRHEAQLTHKNINHRDLPVEAAMALKVQKNSVNTTKRLGHVPGVEVGATFRYRAELVIIGLHGQFHSGIDYLQKDGKALAISVVDSGRYANDKESSDVLIYSGQGGNPKVGYDKQPEDQKLARGNLALKNSFDAKTPVRVTRGFQAKNAASSRYTYEGLYFVDKYWQERGEYGKLVFKFQLKRATKPKFDQGELYQSAKSKVSWQGILNDISLGKEEKSIRVVNKIDHEKPQPFTYVARMAYSENCYRSIPCGCDCMSGCSDSVKCACVVKNGGGIPFNCQGTLTTKKAWIYECGPLCKCPPSCKNRVTQSGIRLQLEVFKTKSTGWGVRSRNFISSGSFVCEYVGELIRYHEAKRRVANDEYMFHLGNGAFVIDAGRSGNVGRFVNHSCSPNLYAQQVFYDHNDKRLPHIMLFATKGIPPKRELTYCYGAQVSDINGQVKLKSCRCGSQECTGRMF